MVSDPRMRLRLTLAVIVAGLLLMVRASHSSSTTVQNDEWQSAAEVGWGNDCSDTDDVLATVIFAPIIGIPLGLSGVLRRRYNKLDASRHMYSLTGTL